MRDYLLHLAYNLSPLDMLFIAVGSFFIGVFLTIIIRLKRESIKYIESDVKPWRREVVIGYRGSAPVYDLMYSAKFVRFLYGRLKRSWAKQAALRQIAGRNEREKRG